MNSTLAPTQLKKRQNLSFNGYDHPFFPELKRRVRSYFENEQLNRTGNINLYLKGLFFLSLYIGSYLTILTAIVPAPVSLILYILMGICAAAIGFNLMHDGSHGSFSKAKWINNTAAYSINLLGGDALLWKNKHNVIHHTYTNIEGYDQDIAQMPVFRLNEQQKKNLMHKYQHIYCFFVYGLSSLLWVFLLDYIKYFSGKIGTIKLPKLSTTDHLVFWTTKFSYFFIYLIIPAYFIGWGYTIVGFLVYHFVLGLTLSIIFQLAHIVHPTEFPEPTQGIIENEWALHQLQTTANFATKNSFITWYTGGLNHQIEHHLFPNISHIHYPALSKIVKNLCSEMDIPYFEFPSFTTALKSHLSYLKHTGKA